MEKFAPFSAESWMYAAQMTVIGMGMIFAVLALLWLVLTLFKFVFVGKNEENNEKKSDSAVNKTDNIHKEQAPVAPAVSEVVDDAVTAAIITAAIAAYMAEQGVDEDGFRVVSFKRVSNRAWNNK